MPFSRSLPCPALAFISRRGVASKANLQSPHDKRMEALVSLYHQSNTFITPENLSAVVDQAFIQPANNADDQKKFIELVKMKKYIEKSQKFFLGRDNSVLSARGSENMGPGWTESRSRRADRVYRALMGTQRDGRPSWLALKENSKRVQSQIDKDSRGKHSSELSQRVAHS